MPPEMAEPSFGDKKISLALKPILESLPVFELSGDTKEVPDDARIEFPFSLIQSQLTSGRITLPPELFEKRCPRMAAAFSARRIRKCSVACPCRKC